MHRELCQFEYLGDTVGKLDMCRGKCDKDGVGSALKTEEDLCVKELDNVRSIAQRVESCSRMMLLARQI